MVRRSFLRDDFKVPATVNPDSGATGTIAWKSVSSEETKPDKTLILVGTLKAGKSELFVRLSVNDEIVIEDIEKFTATLNLKRTEGEWPNLQTTTANKQVALSIDSDDKLDAGFLAYNTLLRVKEGVVVPFGSDSTVLPFVFPVKRDIDYKDSNFLNQPHALNGDAAKFSIHFAYTITPKSDSTGASNDDLHANLRGTTFYTSVSGHGKGLIKNEGDNFVRVGLLFTAPSIWSQIGDAYELPEQFNVTLTGLYLADETGKTTRISDSQHTTAAAAQADYAETLWGGDITIIDEVIEGEEEGGYIYSKVIPITLSDESADTPPTITLSTDKDTVEENGTKEERTITLTLTASKVPADALAYTLNTIPRGETPSTQLRNSAELTTDFTKVGGGALSFAIEAGATTKTLKLRVKQDQICRARALALYLTPAEKTYATATSLSEAYAQRFKQARAASEDEGTELHNKPDATNTDFPNTLKIVVNDDESCTGFTQKDGESIPTAGVSIPQGNTLDLRFEESGDGSEHHVIRIKLKPGHGLTDAEVRKAVFAAIEVTSTGTTVGTPVKTKDHWAVPVRGAGTVRMNFKGADSANKGFTVELLGPFESEAEADTAAVSPTVGTAKSSFAVAVAAPPTARLSNLINSAFPQTGLTLPRGEFFGLKLDELPESETKSHVIRIRLKDGHGLNAEQQKAIFRATYRSGNTIPLVSIDARYSGSLVVSDGHQAIPVYQSVRRFNLPLNRPAVEGKTFVVELLGPYTKGSEHTAATGTGTGTGIIQQAFEVTVAEPVKSKFLTSGRSEIPANGLSVAHNAQQRFIVTRNGLRDAYVLRVKLKGNQGLEDAEDRKAIFGSLQLIDTADSESFSLVTSGDHASIVGIFGNTEIGLTFTDENAESKTFTVDLLGPYDEGIADLADATNANRVAASPTGGTVLDGFDISVGAILPAKITEAGGKAIPEGGVSIAQGNPLDLRLEGGGSNKHRVVRIKLKPGHGLTDAEVRKAIFAAIEVTGEGTTVGTPVVTGDHIAVPVQGAGTVRVNFKGANSADEDFTVELLGPFESEAEADTAAASPTAGTAKSSFDLAVAATPTARFTKQDNSVLPQTGTTLVRGQSLALQVRRLSALTTASYGIRVKLKEGHGLTAEQQKAIFRYAYSNRRSVSILSAFRGRRFVRSDEHQAIFLHSNSRNNNGIFHFDLHFESPEAEGKTFVVELLGPYTEGSEHTDATGTGTGKVQQTFEVTVAEPKRREFATTSNRDIPEEGFSVKYGQEQLFKIVSNGLQEYNVLRVKLKGNQGLEDAEDRKAIFGSLQLFNTDDFEESYSLVTSGDHASIVGIFGNTDISLTFTDENAANRTFTVELLGPYDEGIADLADATNAIAAAQSATAGTVIDSFDIHVDEKTARILKGDGNTFPQTGETLARGQTMRLGFSQASETNPPSHTLRVKLKDGHGLNTEQQSSIFKSSGLLTASTGTHGSFGSLVRSDTHQALPVYQTANDLDIVLDPPAAEGKTFVFELLGPYTKGSEHTAATGTGTGAKVQQSFEVTVTEPEKSKFLTSERGEIPTDGVSAEFGKEHRFKISWNGLPTFHVLRVKLKDNNQGLTNAADREAIFATLLDRYRGTKIISSEHLAVPILSGSVNSMYLSFRDENAAGKTFTVELLGPYDEGSADIASATNANRVAASPTAGTVVDSFDITVGAAPTAKLTGVGGRAIWRETRRGAPAQLYVRQGDTLDLGFEETETDKHRVIRIKLRDTGLTDEQLKALFAAIGVTGQGTTVGTPVHTKDHLSIPVQGSGRIQINFSEVKTRARNFTAELLGPFDSEVEANTAAASPTDGTPTSHFGIYVDNSPPSVKVTRSDDSEIPQTGETLPRGQSLNLKLDDLAPEETHSHVIRVKLKEGHGLTRAQQQEIFKATDSSGNLIPLVSGTGLGERVASDVHQSIPIYQDGNFSITLRHPNAQGKTFVVEILGHYTKGSEHTSAEFTTYYYVQQAFEVTVTEPVKAKFLHGENLSIPVGGLSVRHGRQLNFYISDNELNDYYVVRLKLKGNQGLTNAADRKAIFDDYDASEIKVTSADYMSLVLGGGWINLEFTNTKAANKIFTVELLGPFDENVADVEVATNAIAAAQSPTAGTVIDSFDIKVGSLPGRITLPNGASIPDNGLVAAGIGITDEVSAHAKFTIPDNRELWHLLQIALVGRHGLSNTDQAAVYKSTYVNENQGDSLGTPSYTSGDHHVYSVPIKKSGNLKVSFNDERARDKNFSLFLLGPYESEVAAKAAANLGNLDRDNLLQRFTIKVAPQPTPGRLVTAGNQVIHQGAVLNARLGEALGIKFIEDRGHPYVVRFKLKDLDDGDGDSATIQGLNAAQRASLFAKDTGTVVQGDVYAEIRQGSEHFYEIVYETTPLDVIFKSSLAAGKTFTAELIGGFTSGRPPRDLAATGYGTGALVQNLDIKVAAPPASPPDPVRLETNRGAEIAADTVLSAKFNEPLRVKLVDEDNRINAHVLRVKLKALDDGDEDATTIQGLTEEQREALFKPTTGIVIQNTVGDLGTGAASAEHYSNSVTEATTLGFTFKSSHAAGKTFTVELLSPYPVDKPNYEATGTGTGGTLLQSFDIKVGAPLRTGELLTRSGALIPEAGETVAQGVPYEAYFRDIAGVGEHMLRFRLKDDQGLSAEEKDDIYNKIRLRGIGATIIAPDSVDLSRKTHYEGRFSGVSTGDPILINFESAYALGKTFTLELLGPQSLSLPFQQTFELSVTKSTTSAQIVFYGNKRSIPASGLEVVSQSSGGVLEFLDRDGIDNVHGIRIKLKDIDDGDGNPNTIQGLSTSAINKLFNRLVLVSFEGAIISNEVASDHFVGIIKRSSDGYFAIHFLEDTDAVGKTFTLEILGPYPNKASAHTGADGVGSTAGAKVQQTFDFKVVQPITGKMTTIRRESLDRGISATFGLGTVVNFDNLSGSGAPHVLRIKLKDVNYDNDDPNIIQGLTQFQRKALFKPDATGIRVLDYEQNPISGQGSDKHYSVPIEGANIFINLNHLYAVGRTFTAELLGPYTSDSLHLSETGTGTGRVQQTFDIYVDAVPASLVQNDDSAIPASGLRYTKKGTGLGEGIKLKLANAGSGSYVTRVKLNPSADADFARRYKTRDYAQKQRVLESVLAKGKSAGSANAKVSGQHASFAFDAKEVLTLHPLQNLRVSGAVHFTVELLGPYPSGGAHLEAEGLGLTPNAQLQQSFALQVVPAVGWQALDADKNAIPDAGISTAIFTPTVINFTEVTEGADNLAFRISLKNIDDGDDNESTIQGLARDQHIALVNNIKVLNKSKAVVEPGAYGLFSVPSASDQITVSFDDARAQGKTFTFSLVRF